MLLPKLEAAALQGDRDLVLQLVKVSPQSAREYALETALGTWGDAFEAGNQNAATRWLRIASRVGEALRTLTGDASVHSAVAVIIGMDLGEPMVQPRSFDLDRNIS